jgi:hypothetical protein
MTPSIENYQNAIARIYRGDQVAGAGFWVEGDYLITCAHVIRDVFGIPKTSPQACDANLFIGRRVSIDLFGLSPRNKLFAEVIFYKWLKDKDSFKEDIAALRILDLPPNMIKPIKVLTDYKIHDPYCIFGFPSGHGTGILSMGQILTPDFGGLVHIESTSAEGLAIEGGFSGAPVWNERSEVVVGMVAECMIAKDDQPNPKIGFMVSGSSILSVLEVLSLNDLLQADADTLSRSVKYAYRLCCPDGWAEPMPEGLQDILISLQNMKVVEKQYGAIDRFAALLTLPELNPDATLINQINQWLNRRFSEIQELLDSVRFLIPPDDSGDSAIETESHLVIYIKDGSETARSIWVRFIRDRSQYDRNSGKGSVPVQALSSESFNEKVTIEALPALLKVCLAEVSEKHIFQQLVVHLILPIDWLNHDDCKDYHCWPISEPKSSFDIPVSVGVEYRCVVRIAERLYPNIVPPQHLHRQKWETNWGALHCLKQHEVCFAFASGDDLSTPKKYFARLRQEQHLGLKRSSPCTNFWSALILTGTPAALWLLEDQFVEGLVAIDEIDRLLDCNITMLPEVVRQSRLKALDHDEDTHIGHHLSFLWDDPNLIPPTPPPF